MNSPKIAKFEKVSFKQFVKDFKKINSFEELGEKQIAGLKNIYDEIKLPMRMTTGSAGYDFFCPFYFHIIPKRNVKFPTGIRCKMQDGWTMLLFTRSSFGVKFQFNLDTCVSVIDSDYYYADNEGHILASFTNNSVNEDSVTLYPGMAYMQGVFVQYGITEDDETTGVRTGGIGSTDNKMEGKS